MFVIASIDMNSGAAASFNFANIPSTFTHLQLRCFVRATSSQSTPYDLTLTVNGANPTQFAYHQVRGDGASATSANLTSDNVLRVPLAVPDAFHTANVFGSVVIDILDYANTNKNKTLRATFGWDNNSGSSPSAGWAGLTSSAWFNTNAINRLELATFGNFSQYSRVDLYGISTSNVTGA
jgi:hypothetical protein